MTVYCPTCGTEPRDGARFCHVCGTAIAPPETNFTAAVAPAQGGAGGALPGGAVLPPAPAFAQSPLPYPPGGPPGLPPAYLPYPLVPGIAPPRSVRSGMATAGFWVGLVSIVPGVLLTWVGTIIGITGLIFSLIGLNETRRNAHPAGGTRTGRTLAIWGAILSLVGIALSLAFLIYVLNHLADFGIVLPERTR